MRHYKVLVDRHQIDVHVERFGQSESLTQCFGQQYRVLTVKQEPNYYIEVNGIPHHMMRSDGGLVTSPSPAVVVSVNVAPGDSVKAGTRLAVIETMKMEMSIPAPFAGRVAQLFVTSNVHVEAGTPQ
jgi:biotin carboxyl carrier protein